MDLRVEANPDPTDVGLLQDRIRHETVAAAGVGEDEELAVFAREQGELVGGCYGGSWGGTCELESLWVAKRFRGRGIARQLLGMAEQEARARGCRQVVLLTHALQAPGFYEHLGYSVAGRVNDYPDGSAAVWFCKRLDG